MLSYYISIQRDNMKKIQLNVNEEVYEKYQALCRSNDTSVAVTIRDAMKKEVGYINEKHKFLDNAIVSMDKLLQQVDSETAGEILELKNKLIVITLDKLK